MMPDQFNGDHLNDSDFQSLLVECLERLERGESLNEEHLLRAHPKHADSLQAFLADQEMLRRVASELRDSGSIQSLRQHDGQLEETIDSNPRSNGFAAGDRLRYIGEYEILEEIARGGMGIVFKARQQKLKRVVALKMILSGPLADAVDVERFHREARAAGQLRHPHIVAIHEIGEHDGHHYFTMDYINGHSLSDEIRDESLPPHRAAELTLKTANAVEFAHQRGTLHRDLKPANILIDGDNQPHITDFGLAKVVGDDETRAELTASGQILGTPSYMAPEQAAGKQSHVGPASDIYSLGAVLYACLTGRAPFVADSPVDTLLQVIKKEPIAPRDLNPSVPRDLDTICLKCLQKEPHRRYGSAQLLADDLERFLDGRPVLARPLSRMARAWRWTRRNPTLAAAMAIGLALLLTLALGAPLVAWQQKTIADQKTDFAASQTRFATSERKLRLAAEGALRMANGQLYSNRIALAQREWSDDNAAAALDALDACPEDLRGWEHDYLFSTFHQYHRTLRGHSHFVNSVCLVRQDQQIVSAGLNKIIMVWDLASGQAVQQFPVDNMVLMMDTHPDAKRAVIAGRSSVPRILDLQTGEFVANLSGHRKNVTCVAYSPDGTLIATSSQDGTVKLWDSDTGTLKQSSPASREQVKRVAFSPTGEQVVCCRGAELAVLDVADLNQVKSVKLPTLASYVTFNSDGEAVAAGGQNGQVYIWQVAHDNASEFRVNHVGRVTTVRFAPDDTWIISSAEQDPRIIRTQASTGATLNIYRGHSRGVPSLTVSADGAATVSGGFDGMVKVWDLRRTQGDHVMTAEPKITSATYKNDGRTILAGLRDGTVCELDAVNGRRLRTYDGKRTAITHLSVTSDGKSAVGVDNSGKLSVWRTEDGSIAFQQERAWSFTLSGDGSSLAIVGRSSAKPGLVLDLRSFQEIGEFTGLRPLAMDASSKLLGSSREYGRRFQVTELASGTERLSLPHQMEGYQAARFSPDNRLLAASSFKGTASYTLVYDIASGEKKLELRGHSDRVTCLAFHPGGNRLATGSGDKSVKIWDLETGIETLTLRGHSNEIEHLEFRSDGRELLSRSSDGEVRLWGAEKTDPGIQRPRPFVLW